MPLSKHIAMHDGHFMNFLCNKEENINTDLILRVSPPERNVKIRRKMLSHESTIALIKNTGKTMCELFEEAGMPLKLSESDQAMLAILEALSAEEQITLLEIIRELSPVAWAEIIDDPTKTASDRMRDFIMVKFPKVLRPSLDEKDYATWLSIFPFRKKDHVVRTDWIPSLCNECEFISIPYLFLNATPEISYYSKVEGVDRIFCEYKLLPTLQKTVVRSYCEEKMEGSDA